MNYTSENELMNEDVSPIKNGDFPASHNSFRVGTYNDKNISTKEYCSLLLGGVTLLDMAVSCLFQPKMTLKF